MFPIFANFRGGKAVATSAGVLLGYSWPLFVLLFITFIVTLKITKIVSLTSMIAALVALIYAIVYYFITGDFALGILVAFYLPLLFIATVPILHVLKRHRTKGKMAVGREEHLK